MTSTKAYLAEDGWVRFTGTATDTVGLVQVTLQVGSEAARDAFFNGTTWNTVWNIDRELDGETVPVVARAIDRAGQVGEINRDLVVDLNRRSRSASRWPTAIVRGQWCQSRQEQPSLIPSSRLCSSTGRPAATAAAWMCTALAGQTASPPTLHC
ncbi:MAG: hypothetical protein HC893_17370 [Chloroflexaceae bacterium]|nr:hypothetical protein [Chloroflexaceae bacterium]